MSVSSSKTEPFSILFPEEQAIPVVFASPHSGTFFPESFLELSRLDKWSLRKSEDCYVHEIFSSAAALGAPLLHAEFSRSYIDTNREPYELSPNVFDEELPDFVNKTSPRAATGFGTVPHMVSFGTEIYTGKIKFDDAKKRIETIYKPYHKALKKLIDDTKRKFGYCILIDCHSMPSNEIQETKSTEFDFVLGDCHGTSCTPELTEIVEKKLQELRYYVVRNTPYSGGYTTKKYGNPNQNVHVLQIEINRGLYMIEKTFKRRPVFDRLRNHIAELIDEIARTPIKIINKEVSDEN